MAIIKPLGTDTLLADNHALMHNVFAIDGSSPALAVVVSSNGQVLTNPIRIQTGAVISNPLTTYTLIGANIANNVILLQTGTGAATITLDSGANLSTAIPNVYGGQTLPCIISNASNQTVLVSGSTGMSILTGGTNISISAQQSRTLWVLCSGTNTWNVY